MSQVFRITPKRVKRSNGQVLTDYMHFGEFPFELSAVISKCDFVISDTIF